MIRSCFLVVLLFAVGFANAGEHSIRGTQWGMSRSEVMEIEKWEYVEKKNSVIGLDLHFEGQLKEGVTTKLSYAFHSDELLSLRYRMKGDGHVFQFFYESLKEKYGAPYSVERDINKIDEETLLVYAYKLFGSLSDFTMLKVRWKIHDGETNVDLVLFSANALKRFEKQQDLMSFNMAIIYEHKDNQKRISQILKDRERDARYNVQNDL